MRDFAVEAAAKDRGAEDHARALPSGGGSVKAKVDSPHAENRTGPPPSKHRKLKAFWTKYVRITIEEDESRDHLGTVQHLVPFCPLCGTK